MARTNTVIVEVVEAPPPPPPKPSTGALLSVLLGLACVSLALLFIRR